MTEPQTSVADVVPASLERFRETVRQELQAAFPNAPSGLYHMLRYHLGWVDQHGKPTHLEGGKGLRPTLCLLACEMLGGEGTTALPCAAAVELIHNFSLIHDDVQDGDTERHHQPAVWALWGQAHAIGAGNAMRTMADRALLRLADRGVAPDRVLDASAALTDRCMEMIEGQYMDLALEETTGITTDLYLDLVRRKTGALIDGAMYLGALVATSDRAVAAAFGRCGRLLGMAFQIRDDILGLWGDKRSTGKPIGADIRRRKKSFPAVHALQHAQGEDREAIHYIYSQPVLTDQQVETVLEIMERLDTRTHGQALAQRLCDEAMGCLDGLSLAHAPTVELQKVASFLVVRQY